MLAEIFVLRLEAQLRTQERAVLSEKTVFALFGRDLSAYFEKTAEPETRKNNEGVIYSIKRDLLEGMPMF